LFLVDLSILDLAQYLPWNTGLAKYYSSSVSSLKSFSLSVPSKQQRPPFSSFAFLSVHSPKFVTFEHLPFLSSFFPFHLSLFFSLTQPLALVTFIPLLLAFT